MYRRQLFLLFPVAAGALRADDPWKTKPAAEWTEKDVKRLLNDSPWAHEAMVSAPMPPMGGGRGGGGGGMPPGGGRGGGAPGPGTMGGMQGDPSFGMGAPPPAAYLPRVTVRWESAGPIRQLNMRGGNDQASAVVREYYVLTATGLQPPRPRPDGQKEEFGERLERMKQGLKENTHLTPKGRTPLTPARIELGQNEGKLVIVYFFSRTDEISADDKEVEFDSALGPMKMRAKFKLKDMMYDGKLEL
jgi:hypothetical protein